MDHTSITPVITDELLKSSPRIQSALIEFSENYDDMHGLEVEGIPQEIETLESKDNIVDAVLGIHEDEQRDKKHIKRLTADKRLKIENEHSFDGEFDTYEDDSKIYRKYRLRDKRNTQKKEKIQPQPVKKRRRNSDEGTYHCSLCAKEFDTKTGLLNHKRMHQTEKKFTCALCFSNFNTNALLVAHKAIHVAEKRSYFCQQCKLAFTDHLDFLIHSVSHTKRKLYKCIECGAFYKKESYKAHVFMHYDRKKQCQICSKYYSEKHLSSHVKSHAVSKYICVECGKDCKTKAYYRYHMNTHTGVKTVQCLYCGKGFNNSAQRRIHTRVHTDERPYSCDACPRTFKQWTDLLKHKATHSTEKKFQCDMCQKKFLHKFALRSHIRGHMKDNLYKCPECETGFTSMGGLRTHVLFKHTAERPVRCEACNKGFINNNQYQKHTRSKYHKRNVYGMNFKNEE